MSDHLEINTMIYDNENNIYKYNIDYIRGNHAIMSMMSIDIVNAYPNEKEIIFGKKMEIKSVEEAFDEIDSNNDNVLSFEEFNDWFKTIPWPDYEEEKIFIDITYTPSLSFSSGENANETLFHLIEVEFDDDIFTDLETTENYLSDNTSLTSQNISNILRQKRISQSYIHYLNKEIIDLKKKGINTQNGFITSKGPDIMYNNVEPISYELVDSTIITIGNKEENLAAPTFVDKVFLNLGENNWNFYKTERNENVIFTKWICIKHSDLSSNNYKGEYILSVEDENGNKITLQMLNENNNFVDYETIEFKDVYSSDVKNYFIKIDDTDIIPRSVTFGSVYETEIHSQEIEVTVVNGVLKMNGIFSGITAGGGIATDATRNIYTYIYDNSGTHTYIGTDRPYVTNPLYKPIILPNSDLSGIIITDPATGIILIRGRPAYQFTGDDEPEDMNGIPHTKHFRAFDASGHPIPKIGDEGNSVGDPYIKPLIGPTIKLPNAPSNYCLYYCPEFYITAAVEKIDAAQKQKIIDFHSGRCGHSLGLSDRDLITDGYLYSYFLICFGDETILVDLRRKKVIRSHKKSKKFQYHYQKSQCNMDIYKNMGCNEHVFSFYSDDKGLVECGIQYYKHPQIDNGIRLNIERNFTKGIGLLVRNYKPRLMEIPRLYSFSPSKLYKKIRNTSKPFTTKGIYVGGELWKNISANK